MNCALFSLWLDEGRPAKRESEARAHAAGCEACASALRAAREIEAILARPPEEPAPGFSRRVMRRVRDSRSEWGAAAPLPSLLPWWVRVAAQPAVAVVSLLAALLSWRGGDLLRLATRVPAGYGQLAARAALPLRPWFEPFVSPWVLLALALPAAAGLLWVSWKLYGWCSNLFTHPVAGGPRIHPSAQ